MTTITTNTTVIDASNLNATMPATRKQRNGDQRTLDLPGDAVDEPLPNRTGSLRRMLWITSHGKASHRQNLHRPTPRSTNVCVVGRPTPCCRCGCAVE